MGIYRRAGAYNLRTLAQEENLTRVALQEGEGTPNIILSAFAVGIPITVVATCDRRVEAPVNERNLCGGTAADFATQDQAVSSA